MESVERIISMLTISQLDLVIPGVELAMRCDLTQFGMENLEYRYSLLLAARVRKTIRPEELVKIKRDVTVPLSMGDTYRNFIIVGII